MARIFRHGLVSSTNTLALDALRAGAAEDGDVHVAEAQSAGRGRRGNAWVSEPGLGLYATVVLLPAPPAPAPPGLTIAAGLAALDTVRGIGIAAARLKWPNDLMVDGAKLAGILVEARSFRPERPSFVVGMGLNVGQTTFPAELEVEREVTSLALLGVETTPEAVLARWLPAFEHWRRTLREAPAELLDAYLAGTGLAEREVRIWTHDAWHHGRLLGLDLEAGLRLATHEGQQEFALAHVQAVEAL